MKNKTLIFDLVIASLAGRLQNLLGQTSETSVASRSAGASVTAPPTFKLPDPSGPFGIGRVGYEWIDSSRPDRYSVKPGARRDLMVYLWYPSSRDSSGKQEPYWPGAKQMDEDPGLRPQMTEEFGALWPLIVSGEFRSHAIENAAVARSPKQFPLVLFSHGLGGTTFEYACMIEDLVSHGYVVVAVEHTYTASAVVFPGGRVVVAHHDSLPPGPSPEEQWKRMVASAALGTC